MNAIDKLRMMSRSTIDQHISSLIEIWIAEHVIECGNSFTIDNLVSGKEDAIKHYSRRTLCELVESAVDRGCEIEVSAVSIKGNKKGRDLEIAKKYTRRMFVIVEKK